MTDLSVFKRIIALDEVEDDLTTYLQEWLPRLLAEIAGQRGLDRGSLPDPKFWATTPALTTATLEQVRYPAVLVVSSGTAAQPVKRGDGSYEGMYSFGVACLTTGSNEKTSSKTARIYGRAVSTILGKRPGFADYVEGIDWIDERFTDYINTEQEALSSATEIFTITIKGLFNSKASLPDPPDPDPEHEYEDNKTVRDPNSEPPYWPVSTTTKFDGSE